MQLQIYMLRMPKEASDRLWVAVTAPCHEQQARPQQHGLHTDICNAVHVERQLYTLKSYLIMLLLYVHVLLWTLQLHVVLECMNS